MTRSRARTEDGSAMVDFVLVMLVAVPLVMGVLQLGLVLHVRNSLGSAATEGARAAGMLGADAEAGRLEVRRHLDASLSRHFVAEVEVRAQPVAGVPGYRTVITAEVPVLGIGGPAVTLQVRGHAVDEDAVVRR